MARPASVTKSDLTRTLQCAIEAGLKIIEVVVEPNGVRLITDPLAKVTKAEDGNGILEWPAE